MTADVFVRTESVRIHTRLCLLQVPVLVSIVMLHAEVANFNSSCDASSCTVDRKVFVPTFNLRSGRPGVQSPVHPQNAAAQHLTVRPSSSQALITPYPFPLLKQQTQVLPSVPREE